MTLRNKIYKNVAKALIVLMVTVAMVSSILPGYSKQASVGYSALQITDVSGKSENFAEQYLNSKYTHPYYKADDVADVIVLMNGDSLIETYNEKRPSSSAGQYVKSPEGKRSAAQMKAEQSELIKAVSSEYGFKTKFTYNTVLNGFSGLMKYGQIEALKKDRRVKEIIVSEIYSQPSVSTRGNDAVENSVGADKITGIYDSSDLKFDNGDSIDGTGMIVAVLDTGIDYNHEVFKKEPPSPAVSRGDISEIISSTSAAEFNYMAYVYSESNLPVATLTENEVYISGKIPFVYNYSDYIPDAQSSENHGTHVAGIVAADPSANPNIPIRGVAPNAQIAFMQVFGSEGGSAYTSGILAALNDSVILDVDVVNMSLGMPMGFGVDPSELLNRIYQSVTDAGISLVVAAGNDFSSGYDPLTGNNLKTNPDSGSIGAPATYYSAFSVGSISGVPSPYLLADDTTPLYINNSADKWYNQRDFINEMLGQGATRATYDYVKVPGVGSMSDFRIAGNLAGKIAVVQRGDLTFEAKAAYAQDFGAVACLIYNNVTGMLSMQIDTDNVSIPVAALTLDQGTALAETGRLEINRDYSAGPFISDYSAWGVLPDLVLKPDVLAHGGEVYSSIGGNQYGRFSGTSMASPNAAGAMLLLRQYLEAEHKDLSKNEIRNLANYIMMSTAAIANNEDGDPYSPRKQGAGLANIYNSVKTDAYLYVNDNDSFTKLSVGDDKNKTGTYELTFKIVNMSDTAKSYRIDVPTMTETLSSDEKSVVEKSHMLEPSFSVSAQGGAAVNGSASVSVGGMRSGTITVTVNLSGSDRQYLEKCFENGMFVEGFVKLTPQGLTADGETDVTLSIPWVGFYGDWTKAPMFDYSAYEVAESQADSSVLDKDKLQASVYATIPTSSIYIGDFLGELGMGEFSYSLRDESKKPATKEDKAAISESLNSSFGLSSVHSGLLRSARTIDIDIKNSLTGKQIYSETKEYESKSYYSGNRVPGIIDIGLYAGVSGPDGYAPEKLLGLANNTKYDFLMTGTLDYAGEQNNLKNSFGYSFYVDSDAPLLINERSALRIEERNNVKRYYLDIYVYDNHYIEAMMIGTYSNFTVKNNTGEYEGMKFLHEDYVIPMNTQRNATSYVTYELTEYWDLLQKNGEKLYMQFSDYAKNTSAYQIQIPRANATDMSFSQNEITISTNEVIDLKNYLNTYPANALKNDLIWSADNNNNNILLEGGDGEIMGLAATPDNRPVTVTVSNLEGDKASLKIKVVSGANVSQPVSNGLKIAYEVESARSNIYLDKRVLVGEKGTLSVSLVPWNSASPGNIIWTSSSPEYLKVTSSGINPNMSATFTVEKAMPKKAIPVTITARVEGTAVFASVTFTITEEYEVKGRVLEKYNGFGDVNGVVRIPGSLGVSEIGYQAFANNSVITRVEIPDGIKDIGQLAFANCTNLVSVSLPGNVHEQGSLTKINYGAFYECGKLKTINLDSVEYINAMAFIACKNLEAINTPRVQFIGAQAFEACDKIKSVDIRQVRYMGKDAFAACDSINNILTSSITVIGEGAFSGAPFITLALEAQSIGPGAFGGCSELKSVVLVNDVRSIGADAFADCPKLETLLFAGTVRSIGARAFKGSLSLKSVTMPQGLESLGDYAFAACPQLTEVIFPRTAKLNSVGVNVFGVFQLRQGSSFEGFTVEAGNPYIKEVDGFIYDAGVNRLILAPPGQSDDTYIVPTSVTTIGRNAFSGNEVIQILDTQSKGDSSYRLRIEDSAFETSSLNTISQDALKVIYYIGAYAFAGSKLESFMPYENTVIEYIGIGAFSSCQSLTEFSADLSRLYYLGAGAFASNNGGTGADKSIAGLQRFSSTGFNFAQDSRPETYNGILDLSGAVQLDSISDSAFVSTNFKKIILPENITYIGVQAFASCANLTEIEFNFNLTEIGAAAFMGCESLNQVFLPESLTIIGQSAFNSCSSLYKFSTVYKNGTTKEGLTEAKYLGYQAFYLCPITEFYASKVTETEGHIFGMPTSISTSGIGLNEYLEKIDMPRLQYAGEGAFAGCISLTQVNIPLVLSIGNFAFEDCISLSSINMNSVEYIGKYAFMNCRSLTSAEVSNVKTIDDYAFFYCIEFSTIWMEKVEHIGAGAFGVTAITKLYLPASLKSISEGAFVYMFELSRIEVDPLNKVFKTYNSVLYSVLPSGALQLECYPVKKTDISYTVLDGTLRIGEAAFLGNWSIEEITLPWSLRSIGDAAFLDCQNLLVYRFRSYEAPILESHNDGTSSYIAYMNFTGLIGANSLVMERPVNGAGYDNYIYELFFASSIDGELTPDYYTQAAIDAINVIPDVITKEDKEVVETARSKYNAIQSDEMRGLVYNYQKLLDAESSLAKLFAKNWALIIGLSVGGGVLVLAATAAVIVFFIVRKKKNSKETIGGENQNEE